MAKRRSGSPLRSGVGPMQFGRSRIGWGASASPAAYAMGAAYGRLPRSVASGTMTGSGRRGGAAHAGSTNYRTILNPWGNNVPKRSAAGTNGIGQSSFRLSTGKGARRMPSQTQDEIRIDYIPNDPRVWPIAGAKTVIYDQAGKANRHNTIVNNAFVRGGYHQYNSPTVTGTDTDLAKVSVVPKVAQFTGTDF